MKFRIPILVLLSAALASACSSEQRYIYLEDAPLDTPLDITNNYDATIFPNDQLYISVASQSPMSVRPFNEETNKSTMRGAKRREKNGYLVSQSGYITFPILGKIQAVGKTRNQLAGEIEYQLRNEGYVTDAVVTVEIMNFHVTVIGEVKNPRVVKADGGRLTIFEALAQSGDVTIDGMRTNVVVVRSGVNTQIVDTLDLTRKEILNSPYYYLQQNDIVYVEPTPKKKKKAWRDEDWPHYLTIGASSLRLAYVTIYRIRRGIKLN